MYMERKEKEKKNSELIHAIWMVDFLIQYHM